MSKAIIVMWFLAAGLMLLATQAVGAEYPPPSGPSGAADVPVLKLSWVRPTTRVNGANLPVEQIKNYQLQCEQTVGGGATIAKGVAPANPAVDVESFSEAKKTLFPAYGSYQCTVKTIDTDDRQSTPSTPPVVANWDEPMGSPAAAPTELKITAQPEQGDTVKLTWQSPVKRVDGSRVTSDAMDYYTVVCNGYNSGNAESLITVPVDGSVTHEVERTELFTSYGDYKCRTRVHMQDGADGPWSEYVRVNWRDAPPAPVTNVLIVVDK